MSTLLDAGLAYAARGWLVFPCYEARGAGCTCSDPKCDAQGKHPRIKWRMGASRDPNKIRGWWRKWPSANIAIATGAASGIWVLDVDTDKAGDETLTTLIGNHRIPTTMIVNTGGGGWHYYFTWPADGRVIGNRIEIGKGLDARGEGGYVVAPPSNHKSGRLYVSATGIH